MKPYFSKEFVSLLNGLLEPNVKRRMSLEEVKVHPFFKSVNWEDIENLKQKPAIKPTVKTEGDTSNVDKTVK
jgi:serine/threonine protein kinase